MDALLSVVLWIVSPLGRPYAKTSQIAHSSYPLPRQPLNGDKQQTQTRLSAKRPTTSLNAHLQISSSPAVHVATVASMLLVLSFSITPFSMLESPESG
ncbi:hypothetical protein CIRG_06311 [Coccidioides immitis RMSCC 2394]|uniref:Uncharacterized protein n=1 Tax=Coccidioides immitis RMSCC 2394 TaxID=404692 RepID=A0A0J6YG89_COCIT|nr:hypothetical protein CIRG_06311 [Coccidioides immitis RMSCC 2394]